MKKRILAIIMSIMLLATFTSCGVDKEELTEMLPELVREGRELLDIVYGDGLLCDEDLHEPIRAGYVSVAEDAAYTRADELRTAIDEVFSESYATVLYNCALNGVSYDADSIHPRYIESDDGFLFEDSEFEMDIVKRTPIYDSIKIVEANRFMAKIEITMVKENGEEESDTFTVVYEDEKWKLDSGVL